MESKYSSLDKLDLKAQAKHKPLDERSLSTDFKEIRIAEEKISHSITISKAKSIDEKEEVVEDEDEATEAEFIALAKKPNIGEACISSDPIARRIATGIKINYMSMRDGETGELHWESTKFGAFSFESEMPERVPKSILTCRYVCREIRFSSREELTKFRIVQRVYFRGQCIEEWFFVFGFVIPGSSNSWEQIIKAAHPDEMFSAEELSGNVTFETAFFDDQLLLCKNLVRIYYV
mmetsp:Transcript_3213/g.2864  ORF Transcript_3213/g.2864 Transcript_3213/m.2864 type:complete len:235 (-) Transcript_3213:44-748(-)